MPKRDSRIDPLPSRRRGILRGLAALPVLALLLVGCSPATNPHTNINLTEDVEKVPLTELELLEDPKSYVGPSTATLYQSTIEPITDAPQPQLPATVTSHDRGGDVEVTITDTSRIIGISMTGNIAATAYALGFGDSLVGRDVSTTFPGVTELPLVTKSGHSVDIESILALDPSVVITDGSVGPLDVVLQIRDAGIPLVFVDRELSIEGVSTITRQIAAALGVDDLGEQLVAQTEARIEATLAEIAEIAPEAEEDKLRIAFLYLRGGSGIYYLFGADNGSDALIESLGGIDVTAEIGWVGSKPMTDEAMIAIDPDLILVMTDGLTSVGGVEGLLEAKPAVGLTTAGENRRFVDMADTEIFAFGPRTADILDALARAVYAPENQGVTIVTP